MVITPEDGDAIDAHLAKVLGMTFFSAEITGVQAIEEIEALTEGGRTIETLSHPPLPPPGG